MARVFVGIGSNLGDRSALIAAALDLLRRLPGTGVVKVSALRETEPAGFAEQGKFLNAVAELSTELEPLKLLAELQRIEMELGRVRSRRWGPRTLDLDILLYDDKCIDEPDLKAPHPRMTEREFVLEPLAEIAPEIVHPPTGKTAAELLEDLRRARKARPEKDRLPEGVRYIAIEGPIGVGKTSLARALAGRLGARLVLEPAAENPFLGKFYSDMSRYALPTQLAFLVARYKQQAALLQQDLFEPLVVSDYLLAKDRIFATLTLSDEELELYGQIHEAIAARAAKPDALVFLRADVDTLIERIRRRGIRHEASITREYLERLAAAYEDFFRLYTGSPVVVADTSGIDFAEGGLDPGRVIAAIGQAAAEARRKDGTKKAHE